MSGTLTIQEALILLRSAWRKGSYPDFDELVMTTRNCDKEDAERLRELWLDEDVLAYDPEGLLTWVR